MAIPSTLTYSFAAADESSLRSAAAASIRNKKQQQDDEKTNLLMSKMMGMAHLADTNMLDDSTHDLVHQLIDDRDLIDLMGNVFVDGTEPGQAQQQPEVAAPSTSGRKADKAKSFTLYILLEYYPLSCI